MATRIDNLVPKRIVIDDDRLPLDQARVADLAESMKRVGLINPITVWRPSGLMPQLIAGRHRLEAAKRLKWDEIACVVIDGDRKDKGAVIRAGIAEIDENLIRGKLSPADEATLIARRKDLYEFEFPETKAGVAGGKARQKSASDKMSFAKSTAKATGKDKRSVERAAQRGKVLGRDLKRIRGTSLDKGAELDALARLPAPQREQIIQRAEAGEPVTARETPDRTARDLEALRRAWAAAGDSARTAFLKEITQ